MLSCVRNYILISTLILLSACAATRPPIPPGEVPAPKPVLEADELYGHQVLGELSERWPIDRNDANVERVRNIVEQLAKAAGPSPDPWHAYVLKGDDVINAAATRGNHVFVWTGMLNLVQNDDELATILAHEMAHVLAEHTSPDPAEEASRIIASVAGEATRVIVGTHGVTAILVDLAGWAVQEAIMALVVNPDTQRKEIEADTVGMFLMARANYDPSKAVDFWTRVQHVPEFSSGFLQFLSSHPAAEGRLENLQKFLAAAMEQFRQHGSTPDAKNDSISIDQTQLETWIAVESHVAVHTEPSSKSPVVTTLQKAEHVRVVQKARRPWLKIVEPVSGFVYGPFLAPQSQITF